MMGVNIVARLLGFDSSDEIEERITERVMSKLRKTDEEE